MPRTASTFDPVGFEEEAFKVAMTTSTPEKAGYLLEKVGPRITAAALGLSDARPLKKWVTKEASPKEQDVVTRLDVVFRVVYEITEAYSPAVAASFLRSSNPQLEDEAPFVVLVEGDLKQAGPRVLAAARAFLEG
jgi:hypothetical protein